MPLARERVVPDRSRLLNLPMAEKMESIPAAEDGQRRRPANRL